jgi:hypothetical protein
VPVPSIFWGSRVLVDANGHPYCPGFIGNTFTNNQWDTVKIAIPTPFLTGTLQQLNVDRTPGICDVVVKRGRDIDRKKSAGSDGQRLTFKGINNADIEIAITIWTPEQLDVLAALWNVLQPKVGKGEPVAFDVSHPQFEINSIKSLCFIDSVGMTEGRTSKAKVFTIRAVEYFPPGTKKTVTSIKKAEARDSVLQKNFPKPGDNAENQGPK